MTLPSGRIEELQSRLVLFYTGIKRTASRVAASYVGDLETKRRQMEQMATLVGESIAILTSGRDIEEFGLLLDEAWEDKEEFGRADLKPSCGRNLPAGPRRRRSWRKDIWCGGWRLHDALRPVGFPRPGQGDAEDIHSRPVQVRAFWQPGRVLRPSG